jgi:hypothetical protein
MLAAIDGAKTRVNFESYVFNCRRGRRSLR